MKNSTDVSHKITVRNRQIQFTRREIQSTFVLKARFNAGSSTSQDMEISIDVRHKNIKGTMDYSEHKKTKHCWPGSKQC